jgi:CDP-diacylglycerol--glycerol-3-phosphate 3-phosphatidyltransferase
VLRESKFGNSYLKWVQSIPVPLFQSLSVKPNHLTFLALIFSLITVPAYLHSLWLGGIMVLLSGLVDTLDGGLARRTNQQTKAGAFLDSVFDRYSDFLTLLGIWLFFQFHPIPLQFLITPLLFFILSGSFMVSYTRARGEGLGQSVSIGLFERAERVACLGGGSIMNDLLILLFPSQVWLREGLFFIPLLVLLALGTHITAYQRLAYLLKKL